MLASLGLDSQKTDRILQAQAAVLNVLSNRYDALDDAIHNSDIPFVELGSDDRIAYANAAFNSLVPDAHESLFPTLFGSRAADVSAALRANKSTSLRADIRTAAANCQVRLEIGPLRDEDGERGNYGLLLDQSAERSRLNALRDGVLRTDSTGRIRFANDRAAELLGLSVARLTEMSLTDVFAPEEDEPSELARWQDAETGISSFVHVRTRDGRLEPVRVSSAPYIEAPGSTAGLLLLFVPLVEERARQELGAILIEHKDPRELIEATIQTLHSVFRFEMATFGIFNDACDHFRALAVMPEPTKWDWSTRWFRVGGAVIEWLEKGKTWNNDLPAFIEDLNPDEKDNPVNKAIELEELDSMLVLPIREAGGRFRSLLTLLSRTQKFTAAQLRTLQNLGVQEILQAADAAFERNKFSARRALKNDLNSAISARAIAERLAEGVVRLFGWEYGGVYLVDRVHHRFVLFAEHVKTNRKLLVLAKDNKAHASDQKKETYTQPLSDGMLGSCFKKQSILIAPDVNDPDPDKSYHFQRIAPDQQSAMTVPLFVKGKIEMILDLESSALNAFQGPDLEAARELVADCEQIFAARWHQAIQGALMNKIEQAAIIVDAGGTIVDMNVVAERMLGDAWNKPLASYGAEEHDKEELKQFGTKQNVNIALKVSVSDIPSIGIVTLADRSPLFDDYNHQLWLFTNLADKSRESDWRYLEKTVATVARQTRAPLLMADGLLRSAEKLIESGSTDSISNSRALLKQAANHLLQSDLTLERLSDRFVIQEPPKDAPTQFDAVQALLEEINSLLPGDRKVVNTLTAPDTARFVVHGWSERLRIAYRSALKCLLLLRVSPTDKIIVEVETRSQGRLFISLRLAPDEIGIHASPAIERGMSRARLLASTAVEMIETAIEQHGGTLVNKGGAEFEIELPLIAQEQSL